MKKIITILSAVILLAACSKKSKDVEQHNSPDNSKKYAVQFDVTEFSQEITGFNEKKSATARTAAGDLRHYVNYLLYNVYNADTRVRVKTIYQTSRDSALGLIRDTLPAGRYIIAIIASKDSVIKIPAGDGVQLSYLPGTNLFYKKVQLSVDNVVNQKFELARIVSKLKINITDKIPFDTRNVFFYMEKYPYVGTENNTLPAYFHFIDGITAKNYYYTYSVPVTEADKGRSNFQLETYILNTDTIKISVNVGLQDTLEHVIAEKKIQNVTLETNKKTVLSGSVLGDPGSGVDIGIDSAWRADSIYVEF